MDAIIARLSHERGALVARRHGVLDIGSNSIRLVVYEASQRVPIPVFNERVQCGLGAKVGETGRLDPDRAVAAMEVLARLLAIARAMGAEDLDVVATAAVRDAADGPDFLQTVEQRFGIRGRVLSGEAEARLSALGVVSAYPGADGFVGDLGGGSLEVIDVVHGVPARMVTLPLGPLRLGTLTARNRQKLVRAIDGQIGALPWLEGLSGRTLYAVGGSWRTLARAHMTATAYPLEVIHGYRLTRDAASQFLGGLTRLAKKQARSIPGVTSQRRGDRVPVTALVLERLIALGRPARIVFSAYGLREGCMFERLDPLIRMRDPLLDSCTEIAIGTGRVPETFDTLAQWVEAFFPGLRPETRRLLRAACLLADFAWAEHPAYRGEHAFLRTLRLPVAGIDHDERVFLAHALLARYGGSFDAPEADRVKGLISPEQRQLALRLGVALRLALTLTGGAIALLRHVEVTERGEGLQILLRGPARALAGEVVDRRVAALAAALGRPVKLRMAP